MLSMLAQWCRWHLLQFAASVGVCVTAIDANLWKNVNAGVVDAGGRFAPSGNDTGDQLVAGVIDNGAPRAENIFANFQKNSKRCNWDHQRPRGRCFMKKTEVKISWHCLFNLNPNYLRHAVILILYNLPLAGCHLAAIYLLLAAPREARVLKKLSLAGLAKLSRLRNSWLG